MKSDEKIPVFPGEWSQPRWAKPKRTFRSMWKTSSRTSLANYFTTRADTEKRTYSQKRFTTFWYYAAFVLPSRGTAEWFSPTCRLVSRVSHLVTSMTILNRLKPLLHICSQLFLLCLSALTWIDIVCSESASHGQRPHIAYQTITLSTQSTFFFCGYLTVPPSTGLDTPGHYAPSTSHPPTGFEAYAADGGQKPVLQHFGT